MLLVGTFMSLGQFGLLYTALALGMPAGLASLVLQAQVGLTVLFAAAALREVPTRAQLVGVLVGAAGLVVVGVGRSASTPALAFVVTLAAAASWAVGNVVARRAGSRRDHGSTSRTQGSPSRDLGSTSRDQGSASAGRRSSPRPGLEGLSMTVWSALVVPVPMLGLSLALDGPDAVGHALTHLTLAPVLSTLYTAWLASLVGYGIWNTLLARYPASAVVPFTMLVPRSGCSPRGSCSTRCRTRPRWWAASCSCWASRRRRSPRPAALAGRGGRPSRRGVARRRGGPDARTRPP